MSLAPQARTPWSMVLPLALLFAGLVAAVAGRHEIWRDEAQAWLIATQSHSFAEMWTALRYEGHPAIWYVLLFAVAQVSTKVFALQIVSGLIATVSAGLILRFAPFKLSQKLLLIFGYFLAYEYAVVARSYGLGVLGLVVLCILMPTRRRTYLWIALVLAFLVNVSLFTMIIAAAVCGGLVIDYFWRQSDRRAGLPNAVGSALIVLVATVLAIATILPPRDSVFRLKQSGQVNLDTDNLRAGRVARAISAVWRSYVPIPQLGEEPWNSNLLFDAGRKRGVVAEEGAVDPEQRKHPARFATLPLSITLLLAAALALSRRPAVLIMYLLGTGVMVVFFVFKLQGNPRHSGHLYLLLVVCFWLFHEVSPVQSGPLNRLAAIGDRLRPALWVFLLIVQAAAAMMMAVHDLRQPFSGSRQAAALIRSQAHDAVVIGNPAHRMTAIAAYLDAPIYFPAREAFGSYSQLDQVGRVATIEQLEAAFNRFADSGRPIIFVVGDDPKAYRLFPWTYEYERLADVAGWSGERFFVFRVRPIRSP